MCGRYVVEINGEVRTLGWSELRLLLGLDLLRNWSDQFRSRYNVAPSQPVPIIRVDAQGENALTEASWGLVPRWAKDPASGPRPINARADTVAEKPTFRHALRTGRCLVLASGYYEWKALDAKRKQPVYFRLPDRPLFAFAGLWDRWEGPEGKSLETCTILTTEGNALSKPIHDRMPVILRAEDYARWLDPRLQDPAEILSLAVPYPAELMDMYEVGPLVGKVNQEGPELIARVDPAAPVEPEGPKQLGLF